MSARVAAAFCIFEMGTFTVGWQSTIQNQPRTLCNERLLETKIERHRRYTQGAS
ncbi:MAG: hypothetical protein KatS3mg023_0126 [Armatimonadota bacterium]|nr:MAG: hypothetical protein KatS3mg023_0126 [Armatimonadota bacterium]